MLQKVYNKGVPDERGIPRAVTYTTTKGWYNMKQVITFKLYGVEHKMTIDEYVQMMNALCKSVCNNNGNWKAFCADNVEIISLEVEGEWE